MDQNIYQFIDVKRIEPTKKNINKRKKQFVEIYEDVSDKQAKSQADRCLDCGNPYCQWKCPVHNYIPQWLKLANEGRIIEAAELAHQTNSLPEVCGRVCPQDRLCESVCTLNDDFGAVTIGTIEKYIVDTAFKLGWKPDLSKVNKIGKKVAIVGAGPAGLSCADILSRNGVDVHVFDRYPEIGGLLTFGIPAFKLDKNIIRNRRTIFEEMGVNFHLNTDIGKDLQFSQLLDEYDAIFLSVGTYKSLIPQFHDPKLQNVTNALPFLVTQGYKNIGLEKQEYDLSQIKDKNVIVLGGGDTAMDCVRTSIRLGANSVKCIYRKDRETMPGSKQEVQNAIEEGVDFKFNLQPIEFLSDGETAHGVQFHKTYYDEIKKEFITKTDEIIELHADVIIVAFGFRPHNLEWLTSHNIELEENGTIKVSKQHLRESQTTNSKVFAGGDMVRGSDLVVTAISDGRLSGKNIIKYLKSN